MAYEPNDLPPEVAVQVFAARIEAKLDVALAQHGAKLDEHGRRLADVEIRVRAIESRPRVEPAEVDDLDGRLRAVESRPVVTPRAVWGAVATLGGIVGVALTIADRLYN